MAQQERNSQGGDRALRKARDREDTAPRSVQVAAARPGLGRAGMAPGNPWGGTKEHFLHWYSWVLPHRAARAVTGVGPWIRGCPRCVWDSRAWQGALHQGHGATLQEPLGSQARWKCNGIIDGPLLHGLI